MATKFTNTITVQLDGPHTYRMTMVMHPSNMHLVMGEHSKMRDVYTMIGQCIHADNHVGIETTVIFDCPFVQYV